MAIQQVDGSMLTANLLRYGVDLAIDTDLLFIDATNNRIGINNNAPSDQFHVIGGATIDSLSISGNTLISNTINSDININPNGTGFVVVPRQKVSILSQNGIVYAGLNGELSEDAGLTYTVGTGLNTTLATLGTLNFATSTVSSASDITITATGNSVIINSLKITDLNDGEIPYIGATGDVFGDANFKWETITDSLQITGSIAVDDITIDGSTITTTTNALVLSSPLGVTKITGTTAVNIPSGTPAQRPTSPLSADLRFNTTSLQLEYYDGTVWVVAGTDFQSINQDTFSGDDVTTVFTLSEAAASVSNLLISINGVVQHAGIAYGVSGTTLTFVAAPATSDVIDVRNITRSYSFDVLSNSTGNEIIVLPNGVLDVSNAVALRLPQYTTIQTNALIAPLAGDTVYVIDGDVGSPCLAVYDGTNWQKVIFSGIL